MQHISDHPLRILKALSLNASVLLLVFTFDKMITFVTERESDSGRYFAVERGNYYYYCYQIIISNIGRI